MSPDLSHPFLPLLAATLLLAFLVIGSRLRRRWPLWARVLTRIATLAALTLLLQRSVGSPLRPSFTTEHAGLQFWEQLVEASWWAIAARIAVGLVRLFIVLENRPAQSRIVSDLLAGVIYVATILAIINFSFGVPIGGLLATSGVIAIVLGLALQSTLSDVFSGIAVGLERPYQPGDLLWVEGGIEGRVVQVNWRATQIATGDHNIAIVPNSIIAKARLVNRSAPTPMRSDVISVTLDAGVGPDQCLAALQAAARACRTLLADPSPRVSCSGLRGDGVVYDVGFSVEASDKLGTARAELYTEIHRHLRHAGIALAVAGVPAPPPVAVPNVAQLLESSDLFCVLAAEDRALLAEHFTPQWLEPEDTLLREGDAPSALFVVASGTAEITRSEAAGARVVHRIGPGESFGAVGLITGTPYAVTATALTPLKVYRLDKADIAAAIKLKPDLAAGLEELAKRGQAALTRNAAMHEEAHLAQRDVFLPRLRNFLKLLESS